MELSQGSIVTEEYRESSNNETVKEELSSHDLANETIERLEQLIAEKTRDNEVLAVETNMFERYLVNLQPIESKTDSKVGSSWLNQVVTNRDSVHYKRSKSHSSTSERATKLTAAQKCEIVHKEIEEQKEAIERLDQESEMRLDMLLAQLEEADIELTELKKEKYEFDREVLKKAVHPRTQKIIAEKCLKYFEEKMKSQDALIEKLKLKKTSVKTQIHKVILQLKQKEEMGEVLNEVDFNQLKIENQQYLEKIEERNQDLLRLKLMAGNVLQVLNSHKKKLHSLTKESEKLTTEIELRADLEVKIVAENKLVEAERAKAESINKRLRKNLSEYRVPDVMEYVEERAEIYELNKRIKNMERKVDMAELALKTHQKAWNVLKRNVETRSQWGSITSGGTSMQA